MRNTTSVPGQRPLPLNFRMFFGWRILVYIAVVAGLLLFKVGPELGLPLFVDTPDPPIIVAGRDVAPHLIGALTEEYERVRPSVQVDFREGGTIQAIEDLLNRRAEVALLGRPVSQEEIEIIAAAGDSIMTYPIALGAIAVIASNANPMERLTVDELRDLLTDGQPGRAAAGERPVLVHLAHPNLGLWPALAEQLGLPIEPAPPAGWLAGDLEVTRAVSENPSAIGIVSTLSLPSVPGNEEWRFVAVSASADEPAYEPTWIDLRSGAYLLSHHLYLGCLKGAGQKEASFVDFLFSPRGQRLVDSERFVAAREVAREILLARTVIGGSG
jgi:ABC-type phosphate transport system substrate-binding protein